ncbi:MAG TPA: amidophosphoribosyltransferase [Candidatus Limnocylindria bacterium]|nr:amidophosphoribosyltransferase [Candidatus Limnocylindria bacterium]
MELTGEKCAVFGIFGKNLDVSRLTFYGLFALQHRGQESTGIAVSNGSTLECYKNMGLVTQVYNEETIQNLQGHIAIGHNRYSTSEGSHIKHAQPIVINNHLALGHNGNLPSVTALKEFLEGKDISTNDCSDSELMAKALAYYIEHGNSIQTAVLKAYPLFTGAFCLTILTKDSLVAVRDTYGIRPLCMGKIDNATIFASESCAFHTVGAEFVREVKPGEMVIVTDAGIESVQIEEPKTKVDIFEFVYFARPDSQILGKSIYEIRRNCGYKLADEFKIEADMVVPVPETAMPVATGFSKQSGIPMEMALVKNRYIHRTFIQPEQHSRDLGVKLKLTPLPEVLKGKRIVVIDDSIVRGTTSRQLVKMLFEAGCAEVHLLISSPPVKFPDFYGIDTPKQENLIAAHKTVEEIRQYLGATSLYFLSLKGLFEATGLSEDLFCASCFTGVYPIDLKERAKEVKQPVYIDVKPEGALF